MQKPKLRLRVGRWGQMGGGGRGKEGKGGNREGREGGREGGEVHLEIRHPLQNPRSATGIGRSPFAITSVYCYYIDIQMTL